MEFQQFWEYWQHYQTFKTDLKKLDLSSLTCTCVDFLKACFRFLLIRWSFGLCRLCRDAHTVDFWQV